MRSLFSLIWKKDSCISQSNSNGLWVFATKPDKFASCFRKRVVYSITLGLRNVNTYLVWQACVKQSFFGTKLFHLNNVVIKGTKKFSALQLKNVKQFYYNTKFCSSFRHFLYKKDVNYIRVSMSLFCRLRCKGKNENDWNEKFHQW